MNKEELHVGDIIVSSYETIAKVTKIDDKLITAVANNDEFTMTPRQLISWRPFRNPIKDGRIVSSYTFAVRFKEFLNWIPQNWVHSQPHYLEEFEYMQYVAEALLTYQIQTVTDENEIKYFKNLNLM